MRVSASVPRFAIVGVCSTLIHVSAATGLIEIADWHPSVANAIAFIVANIFSYMANTHWSFDAKPGLGSWSRFLTISFFAWLLTIFISWIVAEAGGPYLLGIMLVVTFIPVLSYIGHRYFTYR